MDKKLLSVIAAAILINSTMAFGAANFSTQSQQPVYQQQYNTNTALPPYTQPYNQPYTQQPNYDASYTTPFGSQSDSGYDNNDDNFYQTQYPLPSYQPQQYQAQPYVNPLQGNVIMVPAGTTFDATTTSVLSSATANLGETVSWILGSDFYYGGKLIASAGSRVNGTVTVLKKAGHAGKNGQLAIRFTNILTPMGQMIPISGLIQTDDGTGVLHAAAAKDTAIEYVKDIGVGAGAGAALGTAMGALSRGSVGKGAIYGTAIGAGLGIGKSLLYKGEDVEIPANVQLQIKIDQPITVNSNTNF